MNSDRRVSLVVPLQDEAETVRALLSSVAQQMRPPDEIVLVDAGSCDSTIERALAVELPRSVRVVRTTRVFPGTARNEGVAAARFEWIAFADGGTSLDPGWLQELLGAAQANTDVVFGNFDPVCDSFFRECAALAYVPPRDRNGVRGTSVASALVRRSTFLSVGGFPPHRAAEDLIFIARLQKAGALTAYAPRAKVRWQIAGRLSTTFWRFADYSYHNLLAGWGRHWHLGVARLYALLAFVIVVSLAVGAGVGALVGVPAFFAARAAKAAWVKRKSFDFRTLHPGRILMTGVLLAVVDAATFWGMARWIARR